MGGVALPSTISGATSGWRQQVLLSLCVGITLLFLAAFALEPLIQQGIGSFFNWYDLKPKSFAGLHQYSIVFDDPVARAALLHTLIYVAITVPLEVVLGLVGAWLALRARRGRSALATLFVLPLVIPWTSAATLFLNFFTGGGVLDDIRGDLFGAHAPTLWLDDPKLAFAIIVVIGIWKGAPWCFLLLFAALRACPVDTFEAGRMEGAGGLSFWLRVVVPSVRPMLVFVIVFRVFAEAQLSNSVTLLTQGGPANATQVASTYDNTMAFQYFEFGAASALSTLTGVVLLVVAGAGFTMLYRSSGGGAWRWRGWLRSPRAPRRWGFGRLVGSSIRRSRRFTTGAALAGVVLTLVPLLGGLPSGALSLDFSLPWSQIGSGLSNSAVLTVVIVVGTLLMAIPVAYVLARGQSRLRSALFLVVLLTMAIPGALVLLPQYQELSWLGLINTRLGLAVLYVAANLPLAVFLLRAAFASVPEGLVESMYVDGASRLRTITRLFIPLSASTIVTVSVFVVIQVWNELPLAAAMLTSQHLYTLPVLVALGIGGTGSLGASWISIAPPLLIFLACRRTFQRGMLPGALI